MTPSSPGADETQPGPPGPRPFLDLPVDEQPEVPVGPAGLRPFVLTSGRAGGSSWIGLETQVVALGDGSTAGLPAEQAAILALCSEPLSVAEISARLRLHLGVARILVDDLRTGNLVQAVSTDAAAQPHSPETILRVMHGLRGIR